MVLASWWARAGAIILDVLVLMPLFLVAFVTWGPETDPDAPLSDVLVDTSTESLVLGALSGLAFALYTTACLALWQGRTVGKRVMRIRVVREDGRAPDWQVAAVRQIPLQSVVAAIVPFFGIVDYLWPLWDRENRALHDMLAHTRVVQDPA